MQIRPITPFKTSSPTQNVQGSIINKQNNSSDSNVISSNNNEVYGRYLAFKALTREEKIEAIQRFIDTEVDPFLEKHKDFYEKNVELNNIANAIDAPYSQRNPVFQHAKSTAAETEHLDFIKDNLEKPIQYYKNRKEFQNLKAQSQKYLFAREYAKDLEPQAMAKNRYLESFLPFVDKNEKTKMDIKNGVANAYKSMPFQFPKKVRNIQEAISRSDMNTVSYNDAAAYKRNCEKMLAREDDTNKNVKIDELYMDSGRIRTLMTLQERQLPELEESTANIQELIEENIYSEEDVETAFNAAHKIIDRTAAHSINTLKKYYETHPRFVWLKSKDEEADKFLAMQAEINKNLRNKIEENKAVRRAGLSENSYNFF